MTDKNFKILVCGMPRSMTTWAFNVLRQLLHAVDVQTFWIEPGSRQEHLFCNAKGVSLGKCHHYSQLLADSADVIVYSYRDLRTAAVSARRKFAYACSEDQLAEWIAAMDRWMPRSDVALRYEAIVADATPAIGALRSALAGRGLTLGPENDHDLLERVNASFRARETADLDQFEASTLILGGHRTFQPPPEQLDSGERQLYDFVESRFGPWLAQHGYLAERKLDAYGQEAEYQIAALLLGAMAGGLAVDVGVEKGSFVDLALQSGIGSVVGFEPLPRHLELLGRRFSATPNVSIHPLAISSSSGSAQLHIAEDRDGHEMDYHHTLADLGDSATVVRSAHAIEVRTAKLEDLVRGGVLPAAIDFLKIDTDGHDLSVLQGLGAIRPRVVLAEYWNTLPETSGNSPYSLEDLVEWAESHGYPRCLIVRRHGEMQLVEWQAPWTIAGDWGNVFLFRADFDLAPLEAQIRQIGVQAYTQSCQHVEKLTLECERKEIVIQELAAAQMQEPAPVEEPLSSSLDILSSPEECAQVSPESQLEAKEQFIQDQERTLQTYRVVLSAVLVALRATVPPRPSASEEPLENATRSEEEVASTEARIADLQTQMKAKDLVIQEQSRALQAFHAVLPLPRRMRPSALASRQPTDVAPSKPQQQRSASTSKKSANAPRPGSRALGIAQRTLQAAQKSAVSEGLRSELQDRAREIAVLRAAVGDVERVDSGHLQALQEELAKKEDVIQEQQRALRTYRQVLPVARGVLPIVNKGRSVLHRIQARRQPAPMAITALQQSAPQQDGDALSVALTALRAVQGNGEHDDLHADLLALDEEVRALQTAEFAARQEEEEVPDPLQDLNVELVRMEQLIQAQDRALRAYRAVMPLAKPLLRLAQTKHFVKQVLQPKLGRLHHHDPIPMRLPRVEKALAHGIKLPRIAIVTPSFRQARFLGRTIDSVLQQAYPQLEYFVQDGGSQDGSVEVLESYGDRLNGWVSVPDGGQSAAINTGFKRTSGDIMAWLNSDDLLLPGALATVGAYFAKHPEVDVVYGHRILIDEEDREIGRWVLPPHDDAILSWADFVPQETMFWRRSLWDKVGGIDESFRFAMDWDLLLRFRDAGARMVRLPIFLGAFRIHEAQKTSAAINEIGMEEMRRLRHRSLGRDASYLEIRRALAPYMLRHVYSDVAEKVRRRLQWSNGTRRVGR